MDYSKYDYIPVEGYKNVFRRMNLGGHDKVTKYAVHPRLKPLVDALIQQRPHWKFVGTRVGGTFEGQADVFVTTYFEVYEGDERIGLFDAGHMWRKGECIPAYEYDTERLRAKRQRGSWTRTSDMGSAVKGILKHFVGKSLTEAVAERLSNVVARVGYVSANASQVVNANMRPIMQEAQEFFLANWDKVVPMLQEFGLTIPAKIPELVEQQALVSAMSKSLSDGKGVTIYVRPTDYVVVRGRKSSDAEVDIVTPDLLPARYKRGLGLLKLTEENQFVVNVGMRCSVDTFYLMDTEEV